MPDTNQLLIDGTPKFSPEIPGTILAIVGLLLEHGADRTRVNKYGSTPLDTARYFGHQKIIELLSR